MEKFNYKKFEIFKKMEAAPETFLFSLKGRLDFEPGQFVQVMLPGIGEATFAPCSSPYEKKYFELSIRSVGNTTGQLVKLEPGDSMLVRGPYGKSWPEGTLLDKNLILIAGGMGIVPLRPLIFKILKYRQNFKKLFLLIGAKTPHHLLFNDDILKWKKDFDYLKVAVEKGNKDWWGDVGMITDLVNKISFEPKNTLALICGPEIMFGFCFDCLFQKKLPQKNIYISFERRMECGIGICQHCNIGKYLVCKDGPVFRLDRIAEELEIDKKIKR